MASNYTEWYIQLINGRTGRPIDDDTGVYNVLTEDDPSEITLYSDTNATSKTNPATMTDGIMQFWTASTTTAVDISVLTANSHAYFLESVTPSQHRIVVWPENINQQLIIPYQVVGASETVVDTGFDIAAAMLIKDVFLHVTTLGTGASLDVGTSTDTDGFLDGVTADATGYPLLAESVASVATPGFGSLLVSITSGAVRKFHVRANATSGTTIMYINTTISSTAGEGYIYMVFDRLPA
mgnify:FL=1